MVWPSDHGMVYAMDWPGGHCMVYGMACWDIRGTVKKSVDTFNYSRIF